MPHFTSGKWPDHRYKCPSWRKAGQEWLLGFFDAVWLSPYQTPPARTASKIPIHPCRFMTTMQVHLYYIYVCVGKQSIWHCMLWCYMFVWRIGKLTRVTIISDMSCRCLDDLHERWLHGGSLTWWCGWHRCVRDLLSQVLPQLKLATVHVSIRRWFMMIPRSNDSNGSMWSSMIL